ncbi:hypothetical protein, variant 2 [Verruconis gallopava]|nr:hypothetical protein, variant 2 [Verruconis gallopava]KIW02092.1 hypothetical protein, variant 2 [Verruconis gallopava]
MHSSPTFLLEGARRLSRDDADVRNEDGPGRLTVEGKAARSKTSTVSRDDGWTWPDPEKQQADGLKHGVREENAKEEEHGDASLVGWDGDDDPENPQNMKQWKKWMVTVSMASMTLCITFASSIFSTATSATAEEFGVSTEVTTLATSLFVLGFAFGPLIFGPISELYGRTRPLFTGFAVFAVLNVPLAVARNLETVLVCRFFGGVFSSAPLAVVGGALADMWDPVNRGIAAAVFSGATFVGPVLGPILGGFVTDSPLGWRWTAWLIMIMASMFGFLGFFTIPETYAPVLLQRRARKLRYQTKNWALHAKSEEEPVDLKVIAEKYLLRPFKMIVMEPILILVTIYMSVIYGIVYLLFEAYPIAFQEQRGWNEGVGALPFLALIVGVVFGAFIIAYTCKTSFKRALEKEGRVIPEARLPPMMIGAFVFPAGMFW